MQFEICLQLLCLSMIMAGGLRLMTNHLDVA